MTAPATTVCITARVHSCRQLLEGSYQGTSSLLPPLAQKLGAALAPVVPSRQLCATIRRKWPFPRETRIPTKFPPTGGLSSSPQERAEGGPCSNRNAWQLCLLTCCAPIIER